MATARVGRDLSIPPVRLNSLLLVEGDPTDINSVAWDKSDYSVASIQRIARVAAHLALASSPPMAVHSIDKANVLATSRLWRSVVTDLFKKEFPQLTLDHQLVDSAAMIITSRPTKIKWYPT